MLDLQPIPFNDLTRCGDVSLDRQHRQITLLLNQLIGIHNLDDPEGHPDSSRDLLLELGRQTHHHFSEEIQFLWRIRYPLAEEEIRAFQRFSITLARGTVQALEFGRADLRTLIHKISSWWTGHLFLQAPRYREHLESVGLRPGPE